jgi:hypothetical protein
MQTEEGLKCAACRKPIAPEKGETRRPARAILPPEKADALRRISNLRREMNQRLDELKAEVLKN